MFGFGDTKLNLHVYHVCILGEGLHPIYFTNLYGTYSFYVGNTSSNGVHLFILLCFSVPECIYLEKSSGEF